MAISVKAFGTGGKRAKAFQDIYFSIEDIEGIGVVYTKLGEFSCVLKFNNPVQKYSADIDCYYEFTSLMASIVETLGEGYAIHKQDVFVRKAFRMPELSPEEKTKRYLTGCYFRFFEGRQFTDADTYLVITQENKKSSLFSYDNSKWKDFLVKIHKVQDIMTTANIKSRFLGVDELRDYTDRYFALNFRDKNFSMTNFKVDSEEIHLGHRQAKIYSLLDVDSVGLPGMIKPYTEMSVNNSVMPIDLMSELDTIPDVDTIVYNQVIFMPNQKKEMSAMDKKKNRLSSLPNPSNLIAAEDIKKVQDVIAKESKQLVYAHYNLVVAADEKVDIQKVTNYVENVMSKIGIHISKRAYNQMELFLASFPGNCYRLNPDYDRFLLLSDAALCLMYKERQSKGDDSPLKCYYTDRQGVPLVVDTTGKEGKIKMTDNSNFFVLGPSGSGKSFFMNTVMRQYYEQDTDCVIVDTGDSYEGICSMFNGTYISYSKEKPISMNPLKVTEIEYNENFTEKKNFLRSMIFLIFKGNETPSKIEEAIIDQTIVEYYREYFTPFEGFDEEDKKRLKAELMLQDKKNGKFDDYEKELEKKYGDEYRIDELEESNISDEKRKKIERQKKKLEALVDDDGASEGEKIQAEKALMRLTPEVVETKYLTVIENKIIKIEHQRKQLRVKELSFNSYYEFAIQRIPQIMREKNVQFDIDNFAYVLSKFYKGGELEYTLNNDMDSSLFDEKFIVFEIDKVKDDPILFPIIVLIIMDVFTQKMRIKKGRKCLVIEEAWKAIATPTMAEYIKY
ncbi:MAG: TraG family conjugative transposon ATPase, partial [Prevotella sp.]